MYAVLRNETFTTSCMTNKEIIVDLIKRQSVYLHIYVETVKQNTKISFLEAF